MISVQTVRVANVEFSFTEKMEGKGWGDQKKLWNWQGAGTFRIDSFPSRLVCLEMVG